MKYISRYLAVFVISFICITRHHAQNFGGVPSKKIWSFQTIDDAQIIFENTIKKTADSIAGFLKAIDRTDPFSLGDNREFLNLIIRNDNLTSNGFVSYFPYRSEFFIHGAQDPNTIGYGEWIKLLSFHEYRHTLQYSNFNYGITKFIHSTLGDASVAGIYNFLVPDWFSEGDAVFYETALTENGRGRLPSFTSELRALLLDSIHYSYEKFRNRSLKDLVPNEYVMGYILATYGHQKYGSEFWKTTLQETGKLKGVFFPFAKAVKRNSKVPLDTFYQNAFTGYQQILPTAGKTDDNAHQQVFRKDPNVKDEILILPMGEQMLLLENSYDEIHTIYKIESGNKKRKLFELGQTTDPFIQTSENRILFINKHVHPRWTNLEFGDIWYYDIEAGKTIRVTKDKKYFSCDYNEKSKRYAAVSGTPEGMYTLLILNDKGKPTDTVVSFTFEYLAAPTWDNNGRFLYFTGRQKGSMSLYSYDTGTEDIRILIPEMNGTISRPFVYGRSIYFSSSINGVDNIHRYNADTGNFIPLTNVLTGAYAPAIDSLNQFLYYSMTTSRGKRIYKKKLEPIAPTGHLNTTRSSEYHSDWVPEYRRLPITHTELHSPGAKQYKPFRHMFNFHSLYLSPDLETPKLSLLSNDYLNTTRAEIYAQYFDADQSFKTGAEISYAKWFPELSLGADHRFNRSLRIRTEKNIYNIPKSETSLTGAARIPLVFSSRQYHQYLILGSQYDLTQEHFDPNDPALPSNFNIQPRLFQRFQGFINWQMTRRKAYRDIFPKWGFLFRGIYKKGWSPEVSNLTYLRSEVFLPGFFKNDGWKLRAQGQWNSDLAGSYLPFELATSSDIQYASPDFVKGGFLTANYILPIGYPEISIPHFLYTKRIAANFFGEYFLSGDNKQNAYGVDLFLTARYFNLLDLTVGLRAQTIDNKNWSLGLILLNNL